MRTRFAQLMVWVIDRHHFQSSRVSAKPDICQCSVQCYNFLICPEVGINTKPILNFNWPYASCNEQWHIAIHAMPDEEINKSSNTTKVTAGNGKCKNELPYFFSPDFMI